MGDLRALRPVLGKGLPCPLPCSALRDVRPGRDRIMSRPVEPGSICHCGNLKEVAGSAGEATVGGERDQGSGEVGDGLNGQADRKRGGYTAAAVDGGESGGG